MDFIIAVAVLTAAYFIFKKVRGPLPPSSEPPRIGGQPYDPNKPTAPVNEE